MRGDVRSEGNVRSSVRLSSSEWQLLEHLRLDQQHLSGHQREELEMLISDYVVIFAMDSSELSMTNVVEDHINTGDSPPVQQQVTFALRAKVDKLSSRHAKARHY